MPGTRVAVVAAAVCSCFATGALAQPSASNSTVGTHLVLQPTSSLGHDPDWIHTIIVRDVLNNPLPFLPVRLRFADCGISFPSTAQDFPGMTTERCFPDIVVMAMTDASGVARFSVRGATLHRQAANPLPCVEVTADDFPIGNLRVSAFDEDGVNGARGSDWYLLACDERNNDASGRSDFNANGVVDFTDQQLWLKHFSWSDVNGTGPRCDGVNNGTGLDFFTTGLKLRANFCDGAGGSAQIVPACGQTDPFTSVYGSVNLPIEMPLVVGYEAVFDLVGDLGSPLEEWWRFDPAGCHEGGLLVQGGGTCQDMGGGCPSWARNGALCAQQFPQYRIEYPYPGTGAVDRALIHLLGAIVPPFTEGPLLAGTEYGMFHLRLEPEGFNCMGCSSAKMGLALKSIRLNQSGAGTTSCSEPALASTSAEGVNRAQPAALRDLQIVPPNGSTENVVFFNGVPNGFQVTSVADDHSAGTWLAGAEPNPMRELTRLRFGLSRAQEASLEIYDVTGRRVRRILSGLQDAGDHSTWWDGLNDAGSRAPTGLYYVRLRTPERSYGKALILRD